MTDIVERARALVAHHAVAGGKFVDGVDGELLATLSSELVRLRLRLADLEVSIAAFRQTVKDWEF